MGDFLLYHTQNMNAPKRGRILETLAKQGSTTRTVFSHGLYNIYSFPKAGSPVPNSVTFPADDFCISSGSFFYKGQFGEDALRKIWQDFDPEKPDPHNFLGIFTLILKKDNRLFLLTDPLGASRVFHDRDQNFWSSSFLATAAAVGKVSPNKQALYEYAFQETTYGTDTVFQEISTANSLKFYEFGKDGVIVHDKKLDFNLSPAAPSRSDICEKIGNHLIHQMKYVTGAFGDKIKTALSGGYDSRLMLSLLFANNAHPGVYVYGPDSSPDVQVAKNIAAGEGFSLSHIDKNHHKTPAPEEYAAIVADNYFALDGYPNEGIFDFGANMATRRDRTAGGHLILNGGGGEIFRNFFYLPDRGHTVSDLINSFYSRYSPAYQTEEFSRDDYRATLHQKIKTALGVTNDKLSRTELEYAYPAFRLRYWTAKDNSNSTRLGSYLTPFICYETIRDALTIPLSYKNHGSFQGDLIRYVSPKLASYLSDYGFSFDEPVPFKKRFKNYLTYYRPPIVRRYSYAVQQHFATLALPKELSADYLAPLLPDGAPFMSRYFNIPAIKDSGLLQRIYTLEYLFQAHQKP